MKKFIGLVLVLIVMLTMVSTGVYAKDYSRYKLGLKREEISRSKKAFRSTLRTELPSKIDLTGLMPPVGDQGVQGSCTAWAVGYAVKSMQEGVDQGWPLNTNNNLFSPAFIYNQINGGKDEGARISDALDIVMHQGCTTLSVMPYNQFDYWTQPKIAAKTHALQYKALTWVYTRDPGDVNAVKNAFFEHRTPLVAGIAIDTDFFNLNKTTNKIYDTFDNLLGGHAITLIGYDDNYPVKTKTVTTRRNVLYNKYVKPTSNIVGKEWFITMKVGGKTLKKNTPLITDSSDYYIKVREDDGVMGKEDKWDDIKIVKGKLKYGVNKISAKVTENAGRHKGKSVTWIFYITRTDKKTTTTVIEKGAFKIQNSWGKGWGENGFGWISYKLFSDPKFNSMLPAYGYLMQDIQETYVTKGE